MKNQDFTTTFMVDKTPQEAFNAIMNVRGWWTGFYSEEFEGSAGKLNDEFIFRAGGGAHYSKQKLVELVPGKKIVWLVTDSKLTFLEDEDEWTGSKISFEISGSGDKTQIRFTHIGLVPQIECFDQCSSAWSKYLEQRLVASLNPGNQKPNAKTMA